MSKFMERRTSYNNTSFHYYLFSFIFLLLVSLTTTSSTHHQGQGGWFWFCSAFNRADVNHRHIAGLWQLTQTKQRNRPLKEFTVYPKDKYKDKNSDNNGDETILLKLFENGQFEQFHNDDIEEGKIPEKLQYVKADAVLDRYAAFGKFKGSWELVDGKLILAADRPDVSSDRNHHQSSSSKSADEDTVLEGDLVTFSEEGLVDNPALSSAGSTASNSKTVVDTHLSVKNGRINVGRFMYSKEPSIIFRYTDIQTNTEGSIPIEASTWFIEHATIEGRGGNHRKIFRI